MEKAYKYICFLAVLVIVLLYYIIYLSYKY